MTSSRQHVNIPGVDTATVSTRIPPVRGRTGDATVQDLRVDAITHTLQTIEYAHHEIHGGSSFTAYYTRTTAATSGHRSGLYIQTPAAGGKLLHIVAQFSASTAANYSICEAPTIAANVGTHGGVIYNRYRDHAGTSGCFDNATVAAVNKFTTLTEAQIAADGTWAVGTLLRTAPLTVGSGPKPAGGAGRDSQEYILKAATQYVFLITNTSADANAHHILIDWYEHANKAA